MDLKSEEMKDFLRDVNNFLSDTLNNEILSSKAQIERQDLLRKLSYLPESAPPYIDMTRSSKCRNGQSGEYVALNTKEEIVQSKLYEEFPQEQHSNYSVPQEQCQQNISIENLILPASKLRVIGKKFGTVYRKEKFMGLFAERSIRCCIGLLGDVLYIYNTEKDTKPVFYINILDFEARPAATFLPKDIKKRDCCFELVCPGKKSYSFLACSSKEMDQWINCINEVNTPIHETHEMFPKKRELPLPPTTQNGLEEYDDIHGKNNEIEKNSKNNVDEIYHNIRDLSLIMEKPATASIHELNDSKITPECDLVYDDIGTNTCLYYNMTESTPVHSLECDNAPKDEIPNAFGYNDEDIYDDIGVVSNTPDIRYTGTIDISCNGQSSTQKRDTVFCSAKKLVFNQLISEITNLDESVSSTDNVYEPVDNPRD